MSIIKNHFKSFKKGEICLWAVSVCAVVGSFALFDRENDLNLSASLIGVTSLIYNAKGNWIGQALMIVFSIFYGIISFACAYYGEMITYLGMTAPMALLSLIAWIKNPYKGSKNEVEVNRIGKKEAVFMLALTIAVTLTFYYILKAINTANLILSTVSVATSFAAAYLTFRRSPLYALGYAANDIVLIVLWTLMSVHNASYISVVICFCAFLINDIYGFISWQKMYLKQRA